MNDQKEFFESLNNSKNKALFSRMKNGDIGVRDEIILSNLNLVRYIINKKFMNTSFDYKDLESVGIIGLIKAVDAFDADKGFKFSTYAITCIENEILMLFRKNYCGEISYDAPLYIDKDGQVLRYSDIILMRMLMFQKKSLIMILGILCLDLFVKLKIIEIVKLLKERMVLDVLI